MYGQHILVARVLCVASGLVREELLDARSGRIAVGAVSPDVVDAEALRGGVLVEPDDKLDRLAARRPVEGVPFQLKDAAPPHTCDIPENSSVSALYLSRIEVVPVRRDCVLDTPGGKAEVGRKVGVSYEAERAVRADDRLGESTVVQPEREGEVDRGGAVVAVVAGVVSSLDGDGGRAICSVVVIAAAGRCRGGGHCR